MPKLKLSLESKVRVDDEMTVREEPPSPEVRPAVFEAQDEPASGLREVLPLSAVGE